MAEEVFTAVAAVTAAEDSMVAVSIHDRQDEAPLLSVMGEALMPLYENKFRCDDSSERESAVNEAKAYVEERFGVSKDEIDVSDNHDDFNDYDDYDEL